LESVLETEVSPTAEGRVRLSQQADTSASLLPQLHLFTGQLYR